MLNSDGNALDRYIEMADGIIAGTADFSEWMDLFAPEAVVHIMGPEPVRGREEIAEFYRGYAASFTEARHLWNSAVLADGTLHASWASVVRRTDGAIQVVAGIEHAKVDASGRITELRNEFTVPPSPAAAVDSQDTK
jgi:hypothetical protein